MSMVNPGGRIAAIVTPDTRICPTSDPRDNTVHGRVKAIVGGTGDRCIIENKPRVVGVDLCHVLGRAKSADDRLMTNIEYWWGHPKRYSLNVDSKSNCFYAIKNLHSLFDAGKWILLPDLKTLEDYSALYRGTGRDREIARKRLAEDDNRRHQYTFVPLHPDMENLAIQWQKEEKPKTADDYEIVPFPFTNRIIDSHVHPKFVILCAGLHLTSRNSMHALKMSPHLECYEERIHRVLKIYASWAKPLSPEQWQETGFHAERPPSKRTTRKLDAEDKTYRGPKQAGGSVSGSRWSARIAEGRQNKLEAQSYMTTVTTQERIDDFEAMGPFQQDFEEGSSDVPLEVLMDLYQAPDSPTRPSAAPSVADQSKCNASSSGDMKAKKRKLDG